MKSHFSSARYAMPVEQTYRKLQPIEHVLLRPDTYVGSCEATATATWTVDAESGEMRLYDVMLDPRGDVDLSADNPELVEEMMQLIAGWKESVGMTERIDIHE